MTRAGLPRVASAILAWAAPRDWQEHITGDLAEEFFHRNAASPIRARWWYRFQVLRVVLARLTHIAATPSGPHRGSMTRIHTDLVSAWRALRRRPRFALIFVAVLGATLGTSGTVIAIADAYLWTSLPYPAAERLVRFTRADGPPDVRQPQNLTALRREALLGEVADLAVAADADGFTIVDGTTPTTVLGMWTTADVFPALGIRPALGRVFTAAEVATASPVALISHALWTERYGADPAVVGRRLTLRGVERPDDTTVFTVIGVLPPRFWHFDDRTAVMAPLRDTSDVFFFRLRDGISAEQAAARLTDVVAAMNPRVDPRWRVALRTLQDEHVAPVRELLHAVTLAVGMLLLIACANLAMLQAVRALGRQQEMAVRAALGASRGRVLTQLLAENLMLAGGAFGLAWAIAHTLTGVVVPAVESYVGRLLPGGAAEVNGRALVVMAGVSLVCAVGFGVLPGLRSGRGSGSLRSHGAPETPRRARVRHVLATVQVAATLALLVGATLMMRTAWHLSRVDLGVDPAAVLNGAVVLGQPTYSDHDQRRAAASELLAALAGLPEVEAASLITGPAFGARTPRAVFRGATAEPEAPMAVMIGVTADYFSALRLPLIAGRPLMPAEVAGIEPVAVVSQSLARRLFPSGDAIGRSVTTTALRPMRDGVEVGDADDARTRYRIVGVAADVRRSLRREAIAEIYVPLLQLPLRDLTLQIRGREGIPIGEVAAAVARAVSSVDPELPLNGVGPLEAVIARQGVRPRFLASVLGVFATLAALGAVIGLYAVSAWVARQRRREAAIRLALGAEPAQVVRTLTTSGALTVTCGLAIGWWASLGLGRLLSRELTGITGDDVATRLVMAGVLSVLCVVAVYRPARAISRISPASMLRDHT